MRLLAMAALCGWGAIASAQVLRVAVVVGNDEGSGAQPALHYAQADARQFAALLTDVGGVDADDLTLVLGEGRPQLREALDRVRARIARSAGTVAKTLVYFYFSGHSDGEALELGDERVAFRELRGWLDATKADVRVAVIDSCRSGGFLAAKGGRLVPGPSVRLVNDLETTGHVILTSSSEDELSLESRELEGSFFTHHLLAGLRGAADASGDGRVTLDEAYRYAFGRTVHATADTLVGTQHPSFDVGLSGKGELVLTELSRAAATLELPATFDEATIVDASRGVVLAKFGSGAGRVVAVPPGELLVRLHRTDAVFEARVRVEAGARARLDEGAFTRVAARHAKAKGGAASGTWEASVGAERAFAAAVSARASTRLAFSARDFEGLTLAVIASTGGHPAFRESSGLVAVGRRFGLAAGAFTFHLQPFVAAGVLWQSRSAAPTLASGLVQLGLGGGARWRLAPHWSVGVEWSLPVAALRADGGWAFEPAPAVWGVVAGTP